MKCYLAIEGEAVATMKDPAYGYETNVGISARGGVFGEKALMETTASAAAVTAHFQTCRVDKLFYSSLLR